MDSQNNLELKLGLDAKGIKDTFGQVEGDLTKSAAKIFDSVSKKFSMKEPSDEIKKFVEDNNKLFEQLKSSKKLDLSEIIWGKINDPQASKQERYKAMGEFKRTVDEMHLEIENAQRKLRERAKGVGLNPDAVDQSLQYGLGEKTYKDYMSAGDLGKATGDNMRMGPQGHDGLRQYAKQAAMYMIGYMVSDLVRGFGQYGQANLMTGADISMRSNTILDLNSIVGTRIETSQTNMRNVMQGLQLRKQGYEQVGSFGGSILGALGGGLLGGLISAGNPVGAMVGAGIGSMIFGSAASEYGGFLGTKDITKEMKAQEHEILKNKFVSQVMGVAEQRVGVFDQLDQTRTKFRARTGGTYLGTDGLGYTQAEQYQLALQQEGVTGHFNQNTFAGQTAFSRAYGYDPTQMYQAGVSTRYTGEEVGANNLGRRKDLADRSGMGNRLPELINSVNSLAVIMAKSGVNPTEGSLMQMANLPFLLSGNSARGRLSDLGMDSIMGINGMFQQSAGTAGDAFLFQAMYGKHGGNLNKFDLMKQQGIFGDGNLRSVIEAGSQYGGKETTQMLFKSLGMDPKGAKTLSDAAYNEDGSVNEDFLKQFESIDTNTEEGKDKLAEITGLSREQISGAEKHKEDMVKKMAEIGEKIAGEVRKMQDKLVEVQNNVLKESKSWDLITKEFNQGVADFVEAVKKLYVEEQTKGTYEEQKKINPNITREQYDAGISGDEMNAMYNILHKKENWKEVLSNYNVEGESSNKDSPLQVGLIDKDKRIYRWMLGDNDKGEHQYLKMALIPGNQDYFNIKDDAENEMFQRMNSDAFHGNNSLLPEWESGGDYTPKAPKKNSMGDPRLKGGAEKEIGAIFNFNYTGNNKDKILREVSTGLDDLAMASNPRRITGQYE